MFVLNLVFSLNNLEGRFSGDDKTPGTSIPRTLRRSLNWLKLKGNEPKDQAEMDAFDPDTARWEDLGEAGTLLIPKRQYPDWVCIRIVQHQEAQPLKVDRVQLVVAFGKPIRAYQPQASPFTQNDLETGRVVTTFVKESKHPGPAWFFPLKRPARRPQHENRTHRYEFSVGLIVTAGDQEYYYGEDPEMDIGM